MPSHGLQLETNTRPASVRERELETGRLVLRAVTAPDPFLARRADAAVLRLESSPARKALGRVTSGLLEGDAAALPSGLLSYGTVLERHGEYEAAEEVYRAVHAARPGDPGAAIHVARAARRAGRRAQALELYRQVGDLCEGNDRLRLLVRIGEALVSEDPVAALSAAALEARAAGDAEALALAREERAQFQLVAGHFDRAVRDLAAAALRFTDRVDRVRVLHRMAELLSGRGDLDAAREALLAARDIAPDRHRPHTIQRLRTLARSMGDQLELRRTRGQGSGALVTLGSLGVRRPSPGRSRAPRLRRWRSRLLG